MCEDPNHYKMSWNICRLAQNNMAQYNCERVGSQIMLLIMVHSNNVNGKRSLDATGKVTVRQIVIKFSSLHKTIHKPAHNPFHKPTHFSVHKPNQNSVHKPPHIHVHKASHNPILKHNYNFVYKPTYNFVHTLTQNDVHKLFNSFLPMCSQSC